MEIKDKNEIVMVKLNQNEIAKNNNKDKKIYLISYYNRINLSKKII